MDGDLHWKYDGEIDYPDSPGTLKKVRKVIPSLYISMRGACNLYDRRGIYN